MKILANYDILKVKGSGMNVDLDFRCNYNNTLRFYFTLCNPS